MYSPTSQKVTERFWVIQYVNSVIRNIRKAIIVLVRGFTIFCGRILSVKSYNGFFALWLVLFFSILFGFILTSFMLSAISVLFIGLSVSVILIMTTQKRVLI